MRAKRLSCVVVLAATVGVAGSGCLSGALYEHVTVPLDTNFDATPTSTEPAVEQSVRPAWKSLVLPLLVVPGQLEFHWGDVSIATAAREAGLERVYYADLERRSILGIWTKHWVRLYGE